MDKQLASWMLDIGEVQGYAGLRNSRVDMPLTNVSLGYFPEGHICERAFSDLTVPNRTGILAGYGNRHIELTDSTIYDRGVYNVIDTVERTLSDTYRLRKYGFRDDITEEELMETKDPFEAESDRVKSMKLKCITHKEYLFAQFVRNAANYKAGLTSTPAKKWSATDATIVDDIKAAQIKVHESGVKANAMILDYATYLTLRYHPTLASHFGSTGTRVAISKDQIKELFQLDSLLVSEAKYSVGGALNSFMGPDVVLYNRAKRATKRQKTFGYHIIPKGLGSERVFRRPPVDQPVGSRVFIDKYYQFKIAYNDAGYVFKNVL